MKNVYLFAAAAVPLLLGAHTLRAGTGAGEEGCPARARLIDLATLFSESGVCAKLPEGMRVAIRAFDEPTALTNFRGFKKVWLQNFDKSKPDSLTTRLDSSIATAFNLALRLPQTDPAYIRLQNVTAKVHALYNAVDLIRPDGGTTVEHLNQIDAALKAVPREEFASDAKQMLDHTARGIANLRQILFCRLADQERAQKVVQVQKECKGAGAPLPPLADAYQMFVGPIQFSPADKPVADGAVNTSSHLTGDSLAAAALISASDQPAGPARPVVLSAPASADE